MSDFISSEDEATDGATFLCQYCGTRQPVNLMTPNPPGNIYCPNPDKKRCLPCSGALRMLDIF